jgi:hypothetical protein
MTIMGRTGNTTGLVKTVAMAVLIAWQVAYPAAPKFTRRSWR